MRAGTLTAARCIALAPPLMPPSLPLLRVLPLAASAGECSEAGSSPAVRCRMADCTGGAAWVRTEDDRTMANASTRLGDGGSVGTAHPTQPCNKCWNHT